MPRTDFGVRRRRWTLAIIALVGLSAIAIWTALWSPLFHARSLRVEGNRVVSQERILKLAGVGASTNLLFVRGGALEARIAADPWVAEVRVERSLPSTLRIVVTERTEAATARRASGWVVLASDGTALKELDHRPRLPEIQGAPAPAIGSRSAAMSPAATFLGALTPDAVAAVERVILEGGLMEARLKRGGRVRLGDGTDVARKADALSGILAWAQENQTRIKTADLSTPDAPAAKVTKGTYEPTS